MKTIEALEDFIHEALSKKKSKEDIKTALVSAGWEEKVVDTSLAAYADIPFEVPVPKPRVYQSARDAFMYLIIFTTLYISAFNIGTLLFQLINKAFPDIINSGNMYSIGYESSAIRFAIASIIITLPLYIFLSFKVEKEIKLSPDKKQSKIRKWLTYLTLFIATCVIIGDMIALIFRVLEGDLTIRFILKVAVILILTASIFGYYLYDLKEKKK